MTDNGPEPAAAPSTLTPQERARLYNSPLADMTMTERGVVVFGGALVNSAYFLGNWMGLVDNKAYKEHLDQTALANWQLSHVSEVPWAQPKISPDSPVSGMSNWELAAAGFSVGIARTGYAIGNAINIVDDKQYAQFLEERQYADAELSRTEAGSFGLLAGTVGTGTAAAASVGAAASGLAGAAAEVTPVAMKALEAGLQRFTTSYVAPAMASVASGTAALWTNQVLPRLGPETTLALAQAGAFVTRGVDATISLGQQAAPYALAAGQAINSGWSAVAPHVSTIASVGFGAYNVYSLGEKYYQLTHDAANEESIRTAAGVLACQGVQPNDQERIDFLNQVEGVDNNHQHLVAAGANELTSVGLTLAADVAKSYPPLRGLSWAGTTVGLAFGLAAQKNAEAYVDGEARQVRNETKVNVTDLCRANAANCPLPPEAPTCDDVNRIVDGEPLSSTVDHPPAAPPLPSAEAQDDDAVDLSSLHASLDNQGKPANQAGMQRKPNEPSATATA